MATSGSGNPIITAALAKMAILRQASDVSDLTLDIYTAELERFQVPAEAVVEACARLQHRPRSDGETAFPDFGALLKLCRVIAAQQASRMNEERYQRWLLETGQREPVDAPERTPEQARAFVAQMRRDVDRLRQ